MGKIHDMMKSAFFNGINKSRGNDFVYHRDGWSFWDYHGNTIVRKSPDGKIEVNFWDYTSSPSTKARINLFVSTGVVGDEFFIGDLPGLRDGWNEVNHKLCYRDVQNYIASKTLAGEKTNVAVLRSMVFGLIRRGKLQDATAAFEITKHRHPRALYEHAERELNNLAKRLTKASA